MPSSINGDHCSDSPTIISMTVNPNLSNSASPSPSTHHNQNHVIKNSSDPSYHQQQPPPPPHQYLHYQHHIHRRYLSRSPTTANSTSNNGQQQIFTSASTSERHPPPLSIMTTTANTTTLSSTSSTTVLSSNNSSVNSSNSSQRVLSPPSPLDSRTAAASTSPVAVAPSTRLLSSSSTSGSPTAAAPTTTTVGAVDTSATEIQQGSPSFNMHTNNNRHRNVSSSQSTSTSSSSSSSPTIESSSKKSRTNDEDNRGESSLIEHTTVQQGVGGAHDLSTTTATTTTTRGTGESKEQLNISIVSERESIIHTRTNTKESSSIHSSYPSSTSSGTLPPPPPPPAVVAITSSTSSSCLQSSTGVTKTSSNSSNATSNNQQHHLLNSPSIASIAYEKVRQISRLKRFLTTLYHFTYDISPEIGQKVHSLVLNLVTSTITIDEFHEKIQEVTRYPLRSYVVPFLRDHLPTLQSEISYFAKLSKVTVGQYIERNEHFILDPIGVNSTSTSSPHYLSVTTTKPSSQPQQLPPPPPTLSTAFEAYEIFQPINQINHTTVPVSYPYYPGRFSPVSPLMPAPPSLTSNNGHNDNYRYTNNGNSNMGIKESTRITESRKRMSPESRKENGLDVLNVQEHQMDDPPLIKRIATSPNGTNISGHPSLQTIRSLYGHYSIPTGGGPLHPIHSNHSNHAIANGISPRPSNHQEQNGQRGHYSDANSSSTSAQQSSTANHSRIESTSTTESNASTSNFPTEDEWKNIYTMLNCILGMVDKTKKALTILQQRTIESSQQQAAIMAAATSATAAVINSRRGSLQVPSSSDNRDRLLSPHGLPSAPITPSYRPSHVSPHSAVPPPLPKKLIPNQPQSTKVTTGHNPYLSSTSAAAATAATARTAAAAGLITSCPPSTFDVMNELKRQASAAAGSEPLNIVERAAVMERMLLSEAARRLAAEEAFLNSTWSQLSNSQEVESSENCWNCGRKANETCSGCNVARYCGPFCQHKDWENHHRVCGHQTIAVSNGIVSSTASVIAAAAAAAADSMVSRRSIGSGKIGTPSPPIASSLSSSSTGSNNSGAASSSSSSNRSRTPTTTTSSATSSLLIKIPSSAHYNGEKDVISVD